MKRRAGKLKKLTREQKQKRDERNARRDRAGKIEENRHGTKKMPDGTPAS